MIAIRWDTKRKIIPPSAFFLFVVTTHSPPLSPSPSFFLRFTYASVTTSAQWVEPSAVCCSRCQHHPPNTSTPPPRPPSPVPCCHQLLVPHISWQSIVKIIRCYSTSEGYCHSVCISAVFIDCMPRGIKDIRSDSWPGYYI